MQPLNLYLRAFFRSALPAQCQPTSQHILLVPTTDVLLNSKDRDSNLPYADLAATEEFLASHVLRVPAGGDFLLAHGDAGRGRATNMREIKNKAKQYNTLNGRVVVVKDAFVYSNRGFKTLNQAQLITDAIFYPDSPDASQWLVYYISRPLVGVYVATEITPAIISDEPSRERTRLLAEASGIASSSGISSRNTPPPPTKKDIKTFGELLNQFPVISRQMQPGLEKIIREFAAAHDGPIPKRPSRRTSISSQRSVPSSIAGSINSVRSSLSGSTTIHPTSIELEPEEQVLRTSLETAVLAAIDLFQSVDRQQLSLLGAKTELTGPVIERMIERYVTEHLHDHTLFPRICALRRPDDLDLESKIRKMADVDIAQVGFAIEGGLPEKRRLTAALARGVEAFKKMGVASSPEEMLEILLNTQKIITETEPSASAHGDAVGDDDESVEKVTPLTISADVLVSMLLIVVIRSHVRHVNARLLYMRYFIFMDEVESGEQGYALATLEAVVAHLTGASRGLRQASKRNRLLWQAVTAGNVSAVQSILQPQHGWHENARPDSSIDSDLQQSSDDDIDNVDDEDADDDHGIGKLNVNSRGSVRGGHDEDDEGAAANSSIPARNRDFVAVNGSLQDVFPFQKPPTPPPEMPGNHRKRVSLASLPRSHSISSVQSSRSHSRNKSVDSDISATWGADISPERLAQTQDTDGNSLLMMAVESGQHAALKALLRMPAHFRGAFVRDDVNLHGSTLLSVAVQSGDRVVTDDVIEALESSYSADELHQYFRVQDAQGRCFAHYLFHQPHLIRRFGKKLPWRLKDKNGQTPLFALCRSYDHDQYYSMVDNALRYARDHQEDDQLLHLDDHVDSKGNALLHVMADVPLAVKILRHCDADVNAANEKGFTPLMVGSKYGRIDLVRALFSDPRVDMTLRDFRGLTAVELAKDDDIRNRIDDLVLLSSPPDRDGRMTTIVRSFFVEDATIRLVIKSGAPNTRSLITVDTCRRSIADFENLARWLSIECPASWLPTHFNFPSPFLLPSKPSRAILRDTQIRLDGFLRNLMSHGTFAMHELVWEFFLMPDLDPELLSDRARRKAEARVDNVKDDYEPVVDTLEVENFVAFARDQVRGVAQATKKAFRATNQLRMCHNDLYEASAISSSALATLSFLPRPYHTALDRHSKSLLPGDSSPLAALYYSLHSVYSATSAIQLATNRPAYLIGSMAQSQRALDASLAALARTSNSTRWAPALVGGFFEDSRRSATLDAQEKSARAREELHALACELRYTQQTIAGELAAWQDFHVRDARAVLKRLAVNTLVRERARLDEMKRALRALRSA